jgi:hypothetical protein
MRLELHARFISRPLTPALWRVPPPPDTAHSWVMNSPLPTVLVNLNCTGVTTTTLGVSVTRFITSAGEQTIPPFGSATNPVLVSGTVSVIGTVQAGGNTVSRVQAFLMGNPSPVGEKTVSVAAGTAQNNVTEANLDTTSLPDGDYTFFVRAIDSAGMSADSGSVTVRGHNISSAQTVSEIRQISTGTPTRYSLVNPGEAPVPLDGTTQILARLYGGSNGYNGNVYLCLQRGNPATGSSNTSVGVQAANIQSGATYDFGYTWETTSSGNTPASAPYDSLFLSGSAACDDISNPATTSVIRVTVHN